MANDYGIKVEGNKVVLESDKWSQSPSDSNTYTYTGAEGAEADLTLMSSIAVQLNTGG